jgi:hypothetical protein
VHLQKNVDFSFVSFFPANGRKHDYMHARKKILNRVLFPKLNITTATNNTMLRLAAFISRVELRFERGYIYETVDTNAKCWSSFVNTWFARTAKNKWNNDEVWQTMKYEFVASGLEGDFIQLLGDIKDVDPDLF